MDGQKLLNNTLRVNAAFSLLAGIDFILFDRTITGILSGRDLGSLAPTGIMLIGFAVFVFAVSLMKHVNKYLVGVIIAMDVLWVLGSILLVAANGAMFTASGIFLILLVAAIIGLFASLQSVGLAKHLKSRAAA